MAADKKGKMLFIAGVAIAILGLAADVIGIGGGAGFGIKQIGVVVAGVVIAFVGKKSCGCK